MHIHLPKGLLSLFSLLPHFLGTALFVWLLIVACIAWVALNWSCCEIDNNLLLSSVLWFYLIGVKIVKLTTTCFSPQEGPILQEKRAWLGRSHLHRAPQWYGPDIHWSNMWGNLRWNFSDSNLWKIISFIAAGFSRERTMMMKMLKGLEEGGEDLLHGPNF